MSSSRDESSQRLLIEIKGDILSKGIPKLRGSRLIPLAPTRR